jgi:ribosomal protein S27E
MKDLVEVPCQQCGKNKVVVEKNHPYFGILCSECRRPTVYKVGGWTNGRGK